MGKVSEGWRDIRDRKSVQTFGALDKELFPEISELMGGKVNSTGTGWERPPLTLWLFAEGNLIRWCFSSQDFSAQLWGASPCLTAVLEDVEGALCKEACSWRKKNEENNGFTRHR